LWGGGVVYELIPSPWTGEVARVAHRLRLLGDDLMLPIAALYAGAAFRLRGVSAVFACWAVYTLAKLVLMQWVGPGRFDFPLEEPLYVLSFGALGVALGDRISGAMTVWHPMHWMGYLAVLMLVVPQLVDIESAADLLKSGLAIAGLMLAALALTWLRQRSAPAATASAPGAWLALAALAGLFASLGPQLLASAKELLATGSATQLFAQFVADLRADDEREATWLQLAGVSVWLSVLFMLLTQWLRGLPKIADDLGHIAAWLRHWRSPLAGANERSGGVQPKQEDARWRRVVARCATVTAWARNIAFAATAAVVLVLASHVLQ
jgi:hypothetical protein